jgi:hypothetical protein
MYVRWVHVSGDEPDFDTYVRINTIFPPFLAALLIDDSSIHFILAQRISQP